jgi:hypothetical protein
MEFSAQDELLPSYGRSPSLCVIKAVGLEIPKQFVALLETTQWQSGNPSHPSAHVEPLWIQRSTNRRTRLMLMQMDKMKMTRFCLDLSLQLQHMNMMHLWDHWSNPVE